MKDSPVDFEASQTRRQTFTKTKLQAKCAYAELLSCRVVRIYPAIFPLFSESFALSFLAAVLLAVTLWPSTRERQRLDTFDNRQHHPDDHKSTLKDDIFHTTRRTDSWALPFCVSIIVLYLRQLHIATSCIATYSLHSGWIFWRRPSQSCLVPRQAITQP